MLMAPKSLLDSHTPGPHKCIVVPYTFQIMFTAGNVDRYIDRHIGRRSGRHSIDTRSPLRRLSIDTRSRCMSADIAFRVTDTSPTRGQ